MTSNNNHNPSVVICLLSGFCLLVLAACGGSGGGGFEVDDTPDSTVAGFNLDTAQLEVTGPTTVGAGSTRNYTATLLDANGLPPDSPPGIRIELTRTAGSTNPPDAENTDNNGQVDFTFRAPNNGTETFLGAQVRNNSNEIALSDRITVTVLETLFQFSAPPENAQVLIGGSRNIQFNWLIGNTGATTGNVNQDNPSAIRFTLVGRSAGGGFRVGGSSNPVQDPVVVNIVNGQLAQTLEVVAGDAGGAVNIQATATTDSQSLNAVLPVVFVGQPTRIAPTPTNISLQQQSSQLIDVRVFDANDTLLANVPLRFNISICIDGQRDTIICNGSGEELTEELRSTDSNGETSTALVAGSTSGGGEIEIIVNGGPGAGLTRAIAYNVTDP